MLPNTQRIAQWAQAAHHWLDVIAGLVAVVAGAATGIAAILGEFGIHVSGMDLAAKTAAVSAAIVIVKALIDSVHSWQTVQAGTTAAAALAAAANGGSTPKA